MRQALNVLPLVGPSLRTGLLVLSMVGNVAAAETYKGYEMPPFELVERIGAVEIRDYAPHMIAEVAVEGSRRAAVSQGFRTLAAFIFGSNETGEKIAMTVPVSQVAAGEDQWRIRFMMPSAAVAQGLPGARNGAIKMQETQAGREAVLQFTGWATNAAIEAAHADLQAALDASGLTATGPMRIYYYDGPSTMPWKRRNEVALPLD